MVQVKIPTPLRKYTAGAGGVEAQGGTVAALVDDLERRHPGIKERICDESGQVRRFVNIFSALTVRARDSTGPSGSAPAK